jgi:predicted ATPase
MSLKLSLRQARSISKADIDISRVNVVGGVNSSGKSTVSKLLYAYLKSEIDDESIDYLMDSEDLSDLKDSDIDFTTDFVPEDVFYIDNLSVLDLKDLDILRVDHIVHIKEALEDDGDAESSEILSKINAIIGCDCLEAQDPSAGIKEIGIIQILLQNGRLKENSFLIIDEPEASLHPQWEIRLAEILVMLAKVSNIHIYLNSHSAMFIEAISLYAQYYGLLNDTRFYLTRKVTDGKYDFDRINPKNMGEVYENLTEPYDELDRLKAKIIFKG